MEEDGLVERARRSERGKHAHFTASITGGIRSSAGVEVVDLLLQARPKLCRHMRHQPRSPLRGHSQPLNKRCCEHLLLGIGEEGISVNAAKLVARFKCERLHESTLAIKLRELLRLRLNFQQGPRHFHEHATMRRPNCGQTSQSTPAHA